MVFTRDRPSFHSGWGDCLPFPPSTIDPFFSSSLPCLQSMKSSVSWDGRWLSPTGRGESPQSRLLPLWLAFRIVSKSFLLLSQLISGPETGLWVKSRLQYPGPVTGSLWLTDTSPFFAFFPFFLKEIQLSEWGKKDGVSDQRRSLFL